MRRHLLLHGVAGKKVLKQTDKEDALRNAKRMSSATMLTARVDAKAEVRKEARDELSLFDGADALFRKEHKKATVAEPDEPLEV